MVNQWQWQWHGRGGGCGLHRPALPCVVAGSADGANPTQTTTTTAPGAYNWYKWYERGPELGMNDGAKWIATVCGALVVYAVGGAIVDIVEAYTQEPDQASQDRAAWGAEHERERDRDNGHGHRHRNTDRTTMTIGNVEIDLDQAHNREFSAQTARLVRSLVGADDSTTARSTPAGVRAHHQTGPDSHLVGPSRKRNRPHVVFPRRVTLVDDPHDPDERRLYRLLHTICADTLADRANKHRYPCSYCQNVVVGVAYVCTQCTYIRLCARCERERVHDETHLLYQIRTPLVSGAIDPPASQIPWISDAHLRTARTIDYPHALNFDEEIELRTRVFYLLSLSEIDALYEQFRQLVDGPVALRPEGDASGPGDAGCYLAHLADDDNGESEPTCNHSWCFKESETSGFSMHSAIHVSHRMKHLGAIQRDRMAEILPSRYCRATTKLEDFIINAIYDSDKDGVVSFPDFVAGTALAVKCGSEAKINTFVRYLVSTANNELAQAIDQFRWLLIGYLDLGKRAFADALHLEQFELELDEMRRTGCGPSSSGPMPEDGSTNSVSSSFWPTTLPQPSSKEPLSDLWDDRREIDTWSTFDPTPLDPVYSSQMILRWGFSIETIVEQVFAGLDTLDANTLQRRLLSEASFVGCITSLFDAAII